MPDVNTTHYDLVKPEPGGSDDTWGGKLNANFDIIDATLKSLQDQITTAVGVNASQAAALISHTNTLNTHTTSIATINSNVSALTVVVNDNKLSVAFPVGGAIITKRSANPATWIGFGTWAAGSIGRAIVGTGTAGGFSWSLNEQAGAISSTLSVANLPSHFHNIDAVPISGSTNSDGSYQPVYKESSNDLDNISNPALGIMSGESTFRNNATNILPIPNHNHSFSFTIPQRNTDPTGSGTPVSVLQPSEAFNVWVRTA